VHENSVILRFSEKHPTEVKQQLQRAATALEITEATTVFSSSRSHIASEKPLLSRLHDVSKSASA